MRAYIDFDARKMKWGHRLRLIAALLCGRGVRLVPETIKFVETTTPVNATSPAIDTLFPQPIVMRD